MPLGYCNCPRIMIKWRCFKFNRMESNKPNEPSVHEAMNVTSVPIWFFADTRPENHGLKTTDKPGHVLAAIHDYFGKLENARQDRVAALRAIDRLRWLTLALDLSIARSEYTSDFEELLTDVRAALVEHQSALMRHLDVRDPQVFRARELFRLELVLAASASE